MHFYAFPARVSRLLNNEAGDVIMLPYSNGAVPPVETPSQASFPLLTSDQENVAMTHANGSPNGIIPSQNARIEVIGVGGVEATVPPLPPGPPIISIWVPEMI